MKRKIKDLIENNYNKNYFNDKIFINHPGKNKYSIIKEVTNAYSEESFCFFNEGFLRQNIEKINDFYLPENPNKIISYAVKSNPKRRILEILNSEGISSFDCASINEVVKVLDINSNSKIFFNNPIKTEKSIRNSSEIGVNHFTSQTKKDVEKILKNSGENVEIALRLKTPNKNAKVNLSEKFGNTSFEILEIIKYIRKISSASIGISIHTGSQNENPKIFSSAIKQISEILKDENEISTINLGGGFPVDYFDEKVNMQSYFNVINNAVKENFSSKKFENTKIIIEPGRSIIAESIDLVVPVLSVDEIDGEKVVYINEGVFSSFSDFTIHGWKYNFKVLKKHGKSSGNLISYKLYGRTCDSGDNLGKVNLPENLEDGDFIFLEKAGAYMDSQSTYFNGFEPPRYVSYNL